MIEILFWWALFAIAVAVWANAWQRNAFAWFLLAAAVSPLIAAIALAVAGKSGKKCPQCAETVRRDATVCRHCGHRFPSSWLKERDERLVVGAERGER